MSVPREAPAFLTWRDYLLTPLIEAALLGMSIGAALAAHRAWRPELFVSFGVFYSALMGATCVFLAFLRRFWPPTEGTFAIRDHPWVFYRWKLHNFLCMTNLFLHYQNSLLPPPIRKFFSQWLGARVGRGLVSIGGVAVDPYLIDIEAGALIGHEALLIPNNVTATQLTLKPIRVRRGAVVGARCVVEPGVEIGAGAMVKAMSWVPEGTTIPAGEVWGGVPAVKMGVAPVGPGAASGFFTGWRDLVLTPLVEVFLLGAAAAGAGVLAWAGAGVFLSAVAFYALLVGVTLFFLAGMRALFPFEEGAFRFSERPWVCYRWNLHGFLCITNLFLHYQNGLLPAPVRRWFSRLLGARVGVGGGMRSMSGLIQDPFFATLGRGCVIAHDALLLPHAMTGDTLLLRRVEIGEGAVVGPRALVMPGARLGAGARVGALSLVTAGTTVPPGEVWRGIPARPVGRARPDAATGIFRTEAPDIVASAGLLFLLCGAAMASAWALRAAWSPDPFAGVLVFYGFLMMYTLGALKGLRSWLPVPPGIHGSSAGRSFVFRWRLYGFLCVTILFLHYQNGLLPPIFRKLFLWALGGRVAPRDVLSVGGTVLDPHRVSLGRRALLGLDSLVFPVDVTEEGVVAGNVDIGDDVAVGPRSVIAPNVVLGAGATVAPLSYVERGTHVPPGETWAGVPARRVP